jgi:hypothetical protein
MARSKCGVLLGILLVGALPALAADDDHGWSYDGNLKYRSADERFQLDFVNKVQARFTVDNPDLGESGQSFELERYRVLFDGTAFRHWDFRLQWDLAKGSLADEEEESQLLLDAHVTFAKKRLAQLWVGQGKVGFTRQALIDFDKLQFIDRAIATKNGNGINQSADENEDYMAAGRLVVTPLGPMELVETDPDWAARPEPRLAVGVSVMTNNMGEGTFEEERINSGGLQLAFRARGLTMSGEFFTESRDTLTGAPQDESDTDGWYAQAGYSFPTTELGMFEVAGRYSEILRDLSDADETEAGIAVNYYFRGHRGKVQFDYRALDFEGIQFGDRIDTEEARLQLQMMF